MKNDLNEDTKTMILDAGIYKAAAVRKAISDYSRFAQFKMHEDDGRIRVEISKIADDVKDTLEYEFCNYILWKLRN
jgi:hypothetical protein